MKTVATIATLAVLFAPSAFADTYNLDIAYQQMNITGKTVKKIGINGTIPGPVLRLTDGEDVIINVTNNLKEDTSIHWHGLLLDGEMDGVPGLNGFAGIKPGQTFSYNFKVRQTGTYWYHSHSKGQEQEGEYGAIVIKPKGEDPVQADRDYVVLLSDFHDDNSNRILSNLKKSSEYYQYARRTVGDFLSDAGEKGFGAAWRDAKMWGQMRMLPTDLADVTGYTFLTNGQTSEQNWTGIFEKGDRVRLRFINASSMSFFDIRIPGLKMQVVGSDGQNVEPVWVDEFRFGAAEIYDVIVTPDTEKAYTIVAEPIDRTGFALSTLAPRENMRGDVPNQRERALLTMADMGESMGMAHDMSGMDHSNMSMADMESMQMAAVSGWAQTGAPDGAKTLDYADLRYLGVQPDAPPVEQEIIVRLAGNMDRYSWVMNGASYEYIKSIPLKYNERVRLTFINETMMAHPMHLHGMFFQLENGASAEKMPNKNMVIIAPGATYSVLLTADEVGEWSFHCHLLYHMMSGMITKVVVAPDDKNNMSKSAEISSNTSANTPINTDGHDHVH